MDRHVINSPPLDPSRKKMKAAPERAWIVPRERVGQRGGFRVDGGHRKRRSPQASSPLGGRLVACGPAPATPRAFDDAGRSGCCTAGGSRPRVLGFATRRRTPLRQRRRRRRDRRLSAGRLPPPSLLAGRNCQLREASSTSCGPLMCEAIQRSPRSVAATPSHWALGLAPRWRG